MRTLAAVHTTKPKLGWASFSDKTFIKKIQVFLYPCSFIWYFARGCFWTWMVHGLGSSVIMLPSKLIRAWSVWIIKKNNNNNIRLNHETNRARLSLCMNKQAAKYQSIGKWFGEQLLFIHRWQKCGPTTEGPGGPHRGHAGKLINSTVNGSTSDSPVKTPNAGLEGKQARQQKRTWTKGQSGLKLGK